MIKDTSIIEDIIYYTNFEVHEPFYTSFEKVASFIKKTYGKHTYNPSTSQWKFKDYQFDNFMIWLPFRIMGDIILNKQTINITPASVSVFKPGDVITLPDDTIKTLHTYSIRFNVPADFQFINILNFPVNLKLPDICFQKMFEKLFQQEKDESYRFLNRRLFILNFFKILIKKQGLELNTSNSRDENEYYLIKKIVQYMHDNVEQKITLQKLEQIFNKNKKTLIALFKKYLHYTPLQYLNRLKIGEAKKYFLIGYSIKEISNKLNYPDVAAFNKAFKKTVQQTPSNFQKLIKQGQFITEDYFL